MARRAASRGGSDDVQAWQAARAQSGDTRARAQPSRHDGRRVGARGSWWRRVDGAPVGPPDRAVAEGRAARKRVPRVSHAAFEPRTGRDPIAILEAQEADRLPDLVPAPSRPDGRVGVRLLPRHARRHGLRPRRPRRRTDIIVQASGDAHLSNFGLFGSPERTLVFDANDFDETLPGPWEWDVKRLAASMVVAGRANGFSAARNREAAMGAVRGYREWIARYAGMRLIDVWYAPITDADIREAALQSGLLQGKAAVGRRTALEGDLQQGTAQGRAACVRVAHGGRRRTARHRRRSATIQHVAHDLGGVRSQKVFTDYRATMAENRRDFLERYRFVDAALKVVGVGSVGTRCFDRRPRGPRRERPAHPPGQGGDGLGPGATPSRERARQPGRARRRRPAADAGDSGHPARLDARSGRPRLLLPPAVGHEGLGRHDDPRSRRASPSTAGLCGWSLARAHARTGDAVAIAAYLGTSDTFDGAIADFAEAYADQNARDSPRLPRRDQGRARFDPADGLIPGSSC